MKVLTAPLIQVSEETNAKYEVIPPEKLKEVEKQLTKQVESMKKNNSATISITMINSLENGKTIGVNPQILDDKIKSVEPYIRKRISEIRKLRGSADFYSAILHLECLAKMKSAGFSETNDLDETKLKKEIREDIQLWSKLSAIKNMKDLGMNAEDLIKEITKPSQKFVSERIKKTEDVWVKTYVAAKMRELGIPGWEQIHKHSKQIMSHLKKTSKEDDLVDFTSLAANMAKLDMLSPLPLTIKRELPPLKDF